MMRNPKELALSAVLESLTESGVQVTQELSALIEDLVNQQWEGRNQDRDSSKDEAALLKLIKDYVARNPSQGENN
jgi:uncharacterized protein YpuA (DUF1002 family)